MGEAKIKTIIIPENNTLLFNKLITPEQEYIKRLVSQYTYCKSDIDDNYSEVLENFFKYIHTYDTSRSLHTWIHIVIRRFVQESVRKKTLAVTDDIPIESIQNECAEDYEWGDPNLTSDNYHEILGDGLLDAIDSLKPIHKEAFLLQAAGYTLSEITDKLYSEGKLKTKNIETVKSRVFLAKEQLRELVTRDGEKRPKSC